MEKRKTEYKINNNNYRELCSLGKGGYGEVKLVQDIESGKHYALKIIPCVKESMLNYYDAEYETLKDLSSEYIIKLIDHMITESEFEKNPLNGQLKRLNYGTI